MAPFDRSLFDQAVTEALKNAEKQQSLLNKEISLIRDFQDDNTARGELDLLIDGPGQSGLLNGSSPGRNDPTVTDMDEFDLLLSNNRGGWLDNV